jgi:hypothetical protein
MVLLGIIGGPFAAVLLTAVPEVAKKPQYIRIGMSVAIFAQNMVVLKIPHPAFRLIMHFSLSGM